SSSESDADAVGEYRFTILRHRHVEARRKRGRLLSRERRIDDLPVAANGFIDHNSHRFIFVIADANLVSVLENIARDTFVVGLFALGHDIEGITEFDAHRLILWRVADIAFTNELLRTGLIGFVNTHHSGGQGLAEAVLFRVLELNKDADFLFDRRAGIVITLV